MNMKSKAFTLIELLVVISIIGILASIVLVALSSSRVKGRNARIQQEVTSLRNQLELGRNVQTSQYADLTGYSTASGASGVANDAGFVNTGITTIVTDILSQNGLTIATGYGGGTQAAGCGLPSAKQYKPATGASNGLSIYTDTNNCSVATKFAIYAAYGPTVGSSGYFCIDSTGQTTSASSGAIPVPAVTAATCQ